MASPFRRPGLLLACRHYALQHRAVSPHQLPYKARIQGQLQRPPFSAKGGRFRVLTDKEANHEAVLGPQQVRERGDIDVYGRQHIVADSRPKQIHCLLNSGFTHRGKAGERRGAR